MHAKGRCLCGTVTFEFETRGDSFDACHCAMCRRWGGGPALVVDAPDGVRFDNEDAITLYPSSDWAERGFCSRCGTHLFYRFKDGTMWTVSLGALDNQEDFAFALQIYIDKKPAHYAFANDTKTMTEAEVLEAFGVGE